MSKRYYSTLFDIIIQQSAEKIHLSAKKDYCITFETTVLRLTKYR